MTADSGTVTGDSDNRLEIGHVKSEWPVTFRRNGRSRSIGMGGHLGSEYAKATFKKYTQQSTRARNTQYHWMAQAYLVGQAVISSKNSSALVAALGRTLSAPEEKRPFLAVMHLFFNAENRPALSKMTTACERLQREFQKNPDTTIDDVIAFINTKGGIKGLYEQTTANSSKSTKKPKQHFIGSFKNVYWRKDAKGKTELFMTELEPGEHMIRVKVGKNKQVESFDFNVEG